MSVFSFSLNSQSIPAISFFIKNILTIRNTDKRNNIEQITESQITIFHLFILNGVIQINIEKVNHFLILNELFASLKRLMDEIVKKNKNFEKNYNHNYTRYKSKIARIAKNTPQHIMRAEIQNYSTNPDTDECQCGEAKLMSAMLGHKLPCSHLYFLKKTFPDLHAPSHELVNSTNGELFFENKITETKKITLYLDYFEKIRRHAYKMIKKYNQIKTI